MNIYKKIYRSMAWNAFESIAYQAILAVHQVCLYSIMPAHDYGIIGLSFALAYLGATCMSAGFDAALTPLFAYIKQDKRLIRSYIIKPLCTQLITSAAISFCAMIIIWRMHGIAWYPSVSLPVWSLILVIAWCEAAHKLCRSLLQLQFKVKKVAWVELSMLIFYLIILWGRYFMGNALSPLSILAPMGVGSFLVTTYYAWSLYRWYAQAEESPHSALTDQKHLSDRLIRNRCMNAGNTAGHALFSGNFIVPIIAAVSSLELAGIFKLVSQWCYMITPIMQKIFGISSLAAFASLKHTEFEHKIAVVRHLSKKLLAILVVILIGVILLVHVTAHQKSLFVYSSWVIVPLFALLLLSENSVIVIEKFCIAEELTSYLIIQHLGVVAGSSLAIAALPLSATMLVAILVIVRLVSFGCLSYCVTRYLKNNKNRVVFQGSVKSPSENIEWIEQEEHANKNELH